MKHIFIVHSYICYYLVDAIVRKHNLPKADVILFLLRGFHPPTKDYYSIDMDVIASNFEKLSIKKILCLNLYISKLDTIIKKTTKDRFYCAYVPQMSMPFAQSLVSNKKCIAFSYIEEGLAFYVKKNFTNHFLHFPWFVKILLRLYNYISKRVELGRPVFGAFKKFSTPVYYYVDSPYAPNLDNVIKVSLCNNLYSSITSKIHYILVLGATLEFNMAKRDNIQQCYYTLIREMNVDGALYVKTHPKTGEETICDIIDVANKLNKQLIFIDDSIEAVLMMAQTSPFVIGGIDSSLLFYAKILAPKAQIYMGYKYLMEIDSIYEKRCGIKSIQHIFHKGYNII